MFLKELLKVREFDLTAKTKLLRHQDGSYDIKRIYDAGMINDYQSVQSKKVFSNCNYIISFLGIENSKAQFIGIYKIVGERKVKDVIMPIDYPYPEFYQDDYYYYDLQEVCIMDDLKERLIIEWGGSTRSWHQWLEDKDKEVLEIVPKGYFNSFPGFLDFTLSFNELKRIIEHPDANRDWHVMLKSVAGVYLILDTVDGMQYIGSAYGKEGIIGRWKKYNESGHGGNKLLQQLLLCFPERYKQFQYTILQTLPKTLTNAEVIKYESMYKRKLGTRSFGLNSN